jgi:hypothetical protein
METNSTLLEFSRFLHEELEIEQSDLALALHKRQRSSDPLPMLLWQYGLISINQLQAILDWLDRRELQEFSHSITQNAFLSNYLGTL